MDEFLREINAAIFWQYIRNYQYENNMQVTVTNETIKHGYRYPSCGLSTDNKYCDFYSVCC